MGSENGLPPGFWGEGGGKLLLLQLAAARIERLFDLIGVLDRQIKEVTTTRDELCSKRIGLQNEFSSLVSLCFTGEPPRDYTGHNWTNLRGRLVERGILDQLPREVDREA